MAIQITGIYRGRTTSFTVDTDQRAPLNVADDETFDRWIELPEWDHRTIEEFAASGGARVAPIGFHVKPPPPPAPPPRRGAFNPSPPTSQPTGPAPMPPTTPPLKREDRRATRADLPPSLPMVGFCGAYGTPEPGFSFRCTRPAGHEGNHIYDGGPPDRHRRIEFQREWSA